MVKKAPHLRVVKGSENAQGSSCERSMDIVSVTALSDVQRKRVEHIISNLCPHAGLLGVAVSPSRAWDLRPFVAIAGETGPSVIRFMGPEVSMCKNIHIRLRDIFTRVSNSQGLSSTISDWGEFEEQLWYRRQLFDYTLRDFLSDRAKLSIGQMLDVVKEVVHVVENWHAKGVFHGHITEDNIVISTSGEALLVDTGVGLSLLQASKSFGFSNVVEGYDERLFATEARTGQTLISSSDVYGLGLILESLIEHIDADNLTPNQCKVVESLFQLSDWASAPDAVRRPSINDIKAHLLQYQERLSERTLPKQNSLTKQTPVVSSQNVNHKNNSYKNNNHPVVNEVKGAKESVARGKTIAPKRGADSVSLTDDKEPHVSLHAGCNSYCVDTKTKSVDTRNVDTKKSPSVTQFASEQIVTTKSVMIKQEVLKPVVSKPVEIKETPIKPIKEVVAQNVVVNDIVAENYLATKSPINTNTVSANVTVNSNNPNASANIYNTNNKSWMPVYIFMALVLIGMEYFYGIFGSIAGVFSHQKQIVYTDEELDVAWASGLPSRVRRVVDAVFQEGRSEHAQELIVEAANAGKGIINGMNMALIRMAFKEEWRKQLNPQDRKAALFFGLSQLVDDSVAKTLVPLTELHPGVILSIMATAASEASLSALNAIPLKKLTTLPIPYGGAFEELVRSNPDATCSSRDAYLLARFMAMGVGDDVRLLKEYVSRDTVAKLKSLALAYFIDDQKASTVIDLLLNHRNIRFEYPYIDWAKRAELLNWRELNGATQLFILAGYTPASGIHVDEKHLLHMLAHPEASIRSYAVRHAIDLVKFNHPAAVEVFTLLEHKPSLLSEKQTAMIARFLVSPDTATTDAVREWLNTNPVYEVLVPFVLSSINNRYESNILDFEIAHYLQRNQWRPTIEQLEQLIYHPTPIMRAFAYSEIKKQIDVQKIRDLLQKALQRETDADLVNMLQSNIAEAMKQLGVR